MAKGTGKWAFFSKVTIRKNRTGVLRYSKLVSLTVQIRKQSQGKRQTKATFITEGNICIHLKDTKARIFKNTLYTFIHRSGMAK